MGNKSGKQRGGGGPSSATPTEREASGAEPAMASPSTSSVEGGQDLEIEERLTGGGKVTIDDFQLMRVLGKGSFGKVMLVMKKSDGQYYAMKSLRKAALVKRNQLVHTATERMVLQTVHHPFIVGLHYAWQTADKLYMVLDYMSGGELFQHLKSSGRFSEERSRLYAAQLTMAIEELHSRDIIYRDLKPENILLNSDGNLKITDFGLSKDEITGAGSEGGTNTFCGTPEYLAPEILQNHGHGKAVDWWSLGTLLYEMLCGLPPFYDTNVQRMYRKILQDPLRLPSHLSEPAKDILVGLLQRRVTERLGSGSTDGAELRSQAFFAVLDFERVYRLEYEPEFVPPHRDNLDVSNFDAEFTSEQAIDSVVASRLQPDQVKFQGFTYDGSQLEG